MPDDTLLSGRYRLGAMLGGGGMADVYAGVDERLGREVAIKLFRGAGDDRHQSEVQVLASLNHPNLVQIYDAELGRPAYVVMELVDGMSLDVLLRTGAAIDVATIGAGVADGLAYAHGRGVIHRDVKPGNVIVADDGRVKLADFGIARLVDQAHLTATGQLMGTAAYLAPEQARGEALTGAADVYSLGLVLLECITGRREYDGPVTEAAVARLTRPPRIPADTPYARLLRDMTATDPTLRPAAAQVSARLRGAEPPTVVLGAAAVPPPTQVLPAYAPEPLQRRGSAWPWVLAAVVLLAVVAGVVAYALSRQSGNGPTVLPPTTPASSVTTSSSSSSPTTTSAPPTTSATTPTETPTTTPTSAATTASSTPPSSVASSPGISLSVPGSTRGAAAVTTPSAGSTSPSP